MSAQEDQTREEILEESRLLKRAYGALFDTVSEILFRHDPMGINFEHNIDEYEPEVGTILPRLRQCSSKDDTRRVVHEEFVRWFDDVGDETKYDIIAGEIWDAWRKTPCFQN